MSRWETFSIFLSFSFQNELRNEFDFWKWSSNRKQWLFFPMHTHTHTLAWFAHLFFWCDKAIKKRFMFDCSATATIVASNQFQEKHSQWLQFQNVNIIQTYSISTHFCYVLNTTHYAHILHPCVFIKIIVFVLEHSNLKGTSRFTFNSILATDSTMHSCDYRRCSMWIKSTDE